MTHKLFGIIYSILGMISFAGFVVYYIKTGLPHLPMLMFALFFAVIFKLEELKK